MKQTKPYGSWPSNIDGSLLSQQSVRLGEPQIENNQIYWLESRPWEKGRSVLMTASTNNPNDHREVLPKTVSVRTKAHEYGGGSYCIAGNHLFYVDAFDQRVYEFDVNKARAPKAITPEGPYRYADLYFDENNGRLCCVREDHGRGGAEEVNEVIAIHLNSNSKAPEVSIWATGDDFYSNPVISPKGNQVIWLSWNHPNMPWQHSQLWMADIDEIDQLINKQCIAGNHPESVFQPRWSPNGEYICYACDRDNWWNLFCFSANSSETLQLTQEKAEFATPQWVFGMSCYGFIDDETILATATSEGNWSLYQVNLRSKVSHQKSIDATYIAQIQTSQNSAVFFSATAFEFERLTLMNLTTEQTPTIRTTTIKSSSNVELPKADLSQPKTFEYKTADEQSSHCFYYPPVNSQYQGDANRKPPLIVMCHGGPTGATSSAMSLKIQYWTSRGFAVADINYRGSTGYGREYRQLLDKNWGVRDVEDVCAAIDFLSEKGLIDADRVAIRGSSAGGYTVLAALTFADKFKAGTSIYGIGDLETLARDTHKFESRYTDSLVAPYPEGTAVYRERSPIHHATQINCPVLFLQGLDDKVVPPTQSESMHNALKDNGIRTQYIAYEGEGHGFRKADTIESSLEAELTFYRSVFKIE